MLVLDITRRAASINVFLSELLLRSIRTRINNSLSNLTNKVVGISISDVISVTKTKLLELIVDA